MCLACSGQKRAQQSPCRDHFLLDSMPAYIDAAYGSHADGKSHSGLVLKVGNASVIVVSSKQKIVTKSSTEAELVALCWNMWKSTINWSSHKDIVLCTHDIRQYSSPSSIPHFHSYFSLLPTTYMHSLSSPSTAKLLLDTNILAILSPNLQPTYLHGANWKSLNPKILGLLKFAD